ARPRLLPAVPPGPFGLLATQRRPAWHGMVQAPDGAQSTRLHGSGPDRVRRGRSVPQRPRRQALPRAVSALGYVPAADRAALRAGRRTQAGRPADPFPAGLTPRTAPRTASPIGERS